MKHKPAERRRSLTLVTRPEDTAILVPVATSATEDALRIGGQPKVELASDSRQRSLSTAAGYGTINAAKDTAVVITDMALRTRVLRHYRQAWPGMWLVGARPGRSGAGTERGAAAPRDIARRGTGPRCPHG